MRRLAAWTIALFLFGAGNAFAQLYKWVDINGRTRYGDIPPPGLDAVRIKPAPPPAAAPAGDAAGKDAKHGPLTPAELEIEFRKRQAQAQAQEEKEREAAEAAANKAANCERAQEGLRNLESGKRIARYGPDGERYFPDEAAIEEEKAKGRELVRQNCN